MSKRGQNEGSIYKRDDGRWVAVVNLGYVAGKRKRKSFYGDTRKEVQEQLTAALRDQQQGIAIPVGKQTVEQYLHQWLEEFAKPSIRHNTYISYASIVRLHLVPEIGRHQLAKLKPQDIQGMLNRKLESGLSPRMVQLILVVLRIALAKAQRWGLVAQNVAKLVDSPRVSRYKAQFLEPEDARRLLQAVQGDRLSALFTVALALGLRKGEALGLRWKDIDFKRKQLTVESNLQFIKGEFVFTDTKSDQGRRTIPLPEVALQSLQEHRIKQDKERQQAGENWQENNLVFSTSHGTPYSARNVSRSFYRLLDKAGLSHMRFHDLRHTCGSLLIAQGVHPRVVMEVLGHSQISVTMNLYAHIIPGLKEGVADKMQAMLSDDEA
ncbi:MAG: site-specific integrase [Ktedonobacterales bacterium]|nr:site-specific integrase [Ktedonobacterales bacterium]